MIAIKNKKTRTFGWVQDGTNLRSLCDVVGIFYVNSDVYNDLINIKIPSLVSEQDGKEELLKELSKRPLKITYSKLVGNSKKTCNSIIQATIKGQKREYLRSWPADNYLRWAHALGFVKYDYVSDSFEITTSGIELVNSKNGHDINEKEKQCIINALLSYPPAVRVLNLLFEDSEKHLTKFEIGKNLGFVGEDGFTNIPQNVLVKALKNTTNKKDKNKIKTDSEGSCDKYARVIARWLEQVDLVEQKAKTVTIINNSENYSEEIGQSYILTLEGVRALNKIKGKSKHKRAVKNVFYEMLATKSADKEYLRLRRSYILKYISKNKEISTYEEICEFLKTKNIFENVSVVKDDIQGLVNIGLNIALKENGCVWKDLINDFAIPIVNVSAPTSNLKIKKEMQEQILFVPHEYFVLLDLAFSGKESTLFEMKVMELLTEECSFGGLHLGGSRKPDGIAYTKDLSVNYGIIIDTKAYSKGYNLPIAQADEMVRYIKENKARDKAINPNEWWSNFPTNVKDFIFMFISGKFIGKFEEQIKRIELVANTKGCALNIINLLLLADAIKGGKINQAQIKEKIEKNVELKS